MKIKAVLLFLCLLMPAFGIKTGKNARLRSKNPVKAVSQELVWKRLEFQLRGRKSEWSRANSKLADLGWKPIAKKDDLKRLEVSGQLVPLPENRYLSVDQEEIPEHRRLTTPGFAKFLRTASAELQIPLVFKSAVRSIQDQTEIRKGQGNLNAANTKGRLISSHLYLTAVDFGYEHMPMADRIKFGKWLLSQKKLGKVQVALEKGTQHCFHIVYLAERPLALKPAPVKPGSNKASRKHHAARFFICYY